MDSSKLVPNDPRVTWASTTSRGHTYSYQVVESRSGEEAKDTIVLLHGFPDISFGWRYQAPHLASLGYRVVVPDLLGYGRTDAPEDPAEYTFKNMSDDVAAISQAVVGSEGKIILGGHDWGGGLAWRIPLWYPNLVKAIFVICTPYNPPPAPGASYVPLRVLVERNILPNFGYQLQFATDEIESQVVGADKIRQFLRTMYGGRTPKGEVAFDIATGLLLDKYMHVGDAPIISAKEMEYMVQEYARHGLKGPLNWYKTREMNFKDDKVLFEQGKNKIEVPSLFIAASQDIALPPRLSQAMEKYFSVPLRRAEVATTHWALEEAPSEVNGFIGEFLQNMGTTNKL